MAETEKPLVYFVLGTTGSGRRAVLRELIAAGLGEGDRVAVVLSDAEAADESDAKLPNVARWSWTEHNTIQAVLPKDATHVFVVSESRRNPVDQVEALKPWLEANGAELGRIFCVVDCKLAETHAALLPWFDACVHFSDVVLLNRREDVENKWISDFQKRYMDQFYPCLFDMVKKDRVKNPLIVLDPTARRISQYFEEEQQWAFESDEDEESSDDEEVELKPAEDPYLERRAGGRRVKEIPEIAKFLPAV